MGEFPPPAAAAAAAAAATKSIAAAHSGKFARVGQINVPDESGTIRF